MSLRSNVIASYGGQIYVTAIGILMVPIYLHILGAESYGLVGIFALMQAWFQLLDMGLSPTLARETARFQGGAVTANHLRGLLRMLEYVFLAVACVGMISFWLGADWIATRWLRPQQLTYAELARALMLMGMAVPLRWASGLYNGAVNGFERQVWLAGYVSVIASLRFIGVLAALRLFGPTPRVFFSYQLAVAAVELGGLVAMTYHLLPARTVASGTKPSARTLLSLGKFSGTVAITGVIWILITQVDKLLLSRFIALKDYGYFTLGVVVANGITLVGTPIAQPLMPRLARLNAEGSRDRALAAYRTATRWLASLLVPAVLLLARFPQDVLWAWTGNAEAARQAAPILRLYAIGNGFLALAAFAYYLQYGRGTLRMHLIGNLGLTVVLVPAYGWAAMHYGGIGVGLCWASAMALYLLVWVALTHRALEPGLHWRWLGVDVALPLIAATTVMLAGAAIPVTTTTRVGTVIHLVVLGAASALASVGVALWTQRRATTGRAGSDAASMTGGAESPGERAP